ncbi:hypothetical protein NC652_018106 [Populus alba x Populus x berolinensis]|nr:hypothetical protein NC652_018102 [Populus alba x Populus x berolinensis]KAJ6925058.1 hypothetical protein NC652_018106 [Populus alba x Populus x berolinensis]
MEAWRRKKERCRCNYAEDEWPETSPPVSLAPMLLVLFFQFTSPKRFLGAIIPLGFWKPLTLSKTKACG